MNLRLLTQKLVRSLIDNGVKESARKVPSYLRHRAAHDEFDVHNGTDTGGFEHIWKFHIHSDNARFGTHYSATTERDLVDALQSLGEDPRRFTFIDLGCGKGRTLIVAARQGFRRVIGVEFAPELAAIARANVSRLGVPNALVVEGDAALFEFPQEPLVLYLYNPFSREVMQQVIANLGRSAASPLYVVYKNPTYADSVLDESGFLARYGALRRDSNIQVWCESKVRVSIA